MVDFNSEGMLGTNRSHILDLIILQRRDDLINAFEEYRFSVKEGRSDTSVKLNRVCSRLEALFMELKHVLERRLDKEEYDELKIKVMKIENQEELITVFDTINKLLDTLNIITIDKKKIVDYTNTEASNESKGIY